MLPKKIQTQRLPKKDVFAWIRKHFFLLTCLNIFYDSIFFSCQVPTVCPRSLLRASRHIKMDKTFWHTILLIYHIVILILFALKFLKMQSFIWYKLLNEQEQINNPPWSLFFSQFLFKMIAQITLRACKENLNFKYVAAVEATNFLGQIELPKSHHASYSEQPSYI